MTPPTEYLMPYGGYALESELQAIPSNSHGSLDISREIKSHTSVHYTWELLIFLEWMQFYRHDHFHFELITE